MPKIEFAISRMKCLGVIPRGKFMSLFQPLVAGNVLENCGRVFVGCKAPTKIAGIFQNFSAEVNTFWKKKTKKSREAPVAT